MTDDGRVGDSRRELLEAHTLLEAALIDLAVDYRKAPSEELADAHALLADRLIFARDEYLALLPYRAVSRCPHTGLVALYPIDDAGLDGLWWRYEAPDRPLADLPPTLFALTGAVDVVDPIDPAPFAVRPGPGAPYVLPRLLVEDQAVAVLSSLTIGRHAGYVIAYYARAPLSTLCAAAEWGTDRWTLTPLQTRKPATIEMIELESERDYELTPWIESGRLRWIAPGDDTLSLRSGIEDCPYLEASGRRSGVTIYDGKIV